MFVGIDPGLSGAVAVISDDGTLVGVHDVPTLTLKVARGTRHVYDYPGMVDLLRPFLGPQSRVLIEEAQAMPGQGVRSMFTIGLGMGAWLGLLAALPMPYTSVRPQIWKRSLGLGKDKKHARSRAQQLFPGADLRRKKDHGRAEALLLAWYGQRVVLNWTAACRSVPTCTSSAS